LGIQKAEQEICSLFPQAKVARIDRDNTQKRGSHESIYRDFLEGKIDILIGTQMIAKGWDIPEVGLVGVISADTALNFPDFRANEKTFQLLTQVAGRTGRGNSRGSVIIQTYNPESPVINMAAKHNYAGFYEAEIEERKIFDYPPFSRIIKLEIRDENQNIGLQKAKELASTLEKRVKKEYNLNLSQILGPSPAFIPKLRGSFRWQILIKTKEKKPDFNLLEGLPSKCLKDIDPISII